MAATVDRMATPSAAQKAAPPTTQPRFWGNGFCCPFHGTRTVGLAMNAPGHLECSLCERTFIQKPGGMSFNVYERGEEIPR